MSKLKIFAKEFTLTIRRKEYVGREKVHNSSKVYIFYNYIVETHSLTLLNLR